MKKITKVICTLASALVTSCAVALTAFATTTWDSPYTVGYTTYYNGHSDCTIYSESKVTNHMSSNYTHTTVGTSGATAFWIVNAVNLDNASRFMGVSTKLYDKKTGSYVSGCTSNNTGTVSAHGVKSASSTYPNSDLTSRYELHYDSYICGGDSQYSPIIESVHFEESIS
ncbi:MAG: hypothetical protein IKG82_13840 [Oscillospiraceae bacterium]|nr:hypothetical protein [Oscillospiraceae bacterium]MBR3419765.1 hypothetical protein [Oscillospiraceae bacterium]